MDPLAGNRQGANQADESGAQEIGCRFCNGQDRTVSPDHDRGLGGTDRGLNGLLTIPKCPIPCPEPPADMLVMNRADRLHIFTNDNIPDSRRRLGLWIIWGSAALLLGLIAVQTVQVSGGHDFGFLHWQPTLYAYVYWAVCLCWGQV